MPAKHKSLVGNSFGDIIFSMNLPIFHKYVNLYREHGYSLYMVGGTSRDILLGKVPDDFDFATPATPEEEKKFLPEADYAFAKFGSIKLKELGIEVDITTFREEGEYLDLRHPSYINFVASAEKDSERRDFTINALYINGEGDVLDFHHGLEDLRNKVIRFIGNPEIRVQEDPLRILRAERFARRLGFQIERASQKAMDDNRCLLEKINPEKVKSEEKKG